ncbi:hypothetical protein K8R66_00145 [bacterium]|nr:hypothetical protein [bacterium]
MKKYIFYTSDGFTENNNFELSENCQILGWQEGKDEKEAFENLKKENQNIRFFKKICCQELAENKVYYF